MPQKKIESPLLKIDGESIECVIYFLCETKTLNSHLDSHTNKLANKINQSFE